MPEYRVPLVYVPPTNTVAGHWPLELLSHARVKMTKLRSRANGREFQHTDWDAQPEDKRVVWSGNDERPEDVEAIVQVKRWTLVDIGQMIALLGAVGSTLSLAIPYFTDNSNGEEDGAAQNEEHCCYERDACQRKFDNYKTTHDCEVKR